VLQRLASERDEARLEDFNASLRNDFVGDGSEFVVLDKTSKNERTYARHYGRAPNGQRARLAAYRCFCSRRSLLCVCFHDNTIVDGYLVARVVEGLFDSQKFYDSVAKDVTNLTFLYLLSFQQLFCEVQNVHCNISYIMSGFIQSLGISYQRTRITTSLSGVPLLFILNDLHLIIFPW
jgi:hypothetical protein